MMVRQALPHMTLLGLQEFQLPSVDDPCKPQFPITLDWIIRNQLEDGSWGEPNSFLLYDRLVCTLACVLALKTWKRGDNQIMKGLNFLWSHVDRLEESSDCLMTCGFEVIFPSMLNDGRMLGLDLPFEFPYLKKLFTLREKKISRIPVTLMHSTHTTLLYSIEALKEIAEWDKIIKLKSTDGSILGSASATAAVYMNTGDIGCLKFLSHIVERFEDHATCNYPIDLLERIWAVDTVQRLGIDHHFCQEITNALYYVYRNIGKRGVSWGRFCPIADIDCTCMALRLMRLHGYPTDPDVLEYFRDENGDFVCFPGETQQGVSVMFNLYRFSQISFPGEEILKEAKSFCQTYLRNCLQNNQVDDKWSLKKALNKEVDFALCYPWKISLQRLESKEYIKHYGENDVWLAKNIYWMYNVNNPKYLELAKLDYSRLQSMYKNEIHSILMWWNSCGFDKYPFSSQVCPQEIHMLIAATLYEPDFSACRIAYTKCNCIENILRDLFENHESVTDLILMYRATELWNPSVVHSLPTILKEAFMGMFHTLNDLAIQASSVQEEDVFPYLHSLRLKTIEEYLNNRNLRTVKFSSLKQYTELGKRDVAIAIRVLPAMFLQGEHLPDNILRSLDSRSYLHDRLSLFLRLLTDVTRRKTATDIETEVSCLMNEEKCSEEVAIEKLRAKMEDIYHEIVHEYLKPSRVPRFCRRILFEHVRIMLFLNDDKETSLPPRERVDDVMKCLFTLA